MQTKSFLRNFEKFTFIKKLLSSVWRSVIGYGLRIEVNFSKLTDRTKFSGKTLFVFVITSVKFQLKLLSVKFLILMISL